MTVTYRIPKGYENEVLPSEYEFPPGVGDHIITLQGTELRVVKRIHTVQQGAPRLIYVLEKE